MTKMTKYALLGTLEDEANSAYMAEDFSAERAYDRAQNYIERYFNESEPANAKDDKSESLDEAATAAYDRGVVDGKRLGYEDGLRDGRDDIARNSQMVADYDTLVKALQESNDKGWAKADAAYDTGYANGLSDGHDEREAAVTTAYQKGLDEGFRDGEAAGHADEVMAEAVFAADEAYDEGFANGIEYGRNALLTNEDHGQYADGYAAGYASGVRTAEATVREALDVLSGARDHRAEWDKDNA